MGKKAITSVVGLFLTLFICFAIINVEGRIISIGLARTEIIIALKYIMYHIYIMFAGVQLAAQYLIWRHGFIWLSVGLLLVPLIASIGSIVLLGIWVEDLQTGNGS